MKSKKSSAGRRPKQGAARNGASHGSPPNITMQKVAKLAGVSAMTVSRALKSDAVISPLTRDRVLKVVKQTGYVPDATARVFASGRSGFVAVLVPSINSSNFADTARGMTGAFERAGLQILLGDTGYSLKREEVLIGILLKRRPEAIVLTGGVHTPEARKMLAAADIPIVEIWDLPKAPLGHVVGFSNAAAGRAMVRYLYDRGRRRIGFIGGTTNRDIRGSERRAGYIKGVKELGLPEGRIVAFGKPPVSIEQGGEALGLMLEQWPDVDAVACVSDLSAFGVLMECHRRGIAVPGRLAIAGFGDFDVGRCAWPRLTTIGIDCVGIGERAAEIVLDAIGARDRRGAMPPARVTMEFKVIARETT
ncbi:LacI family DNA-binding transcriptional regulator [Methylocapsa sp. S129]|uniref:LacI family DNA-binding transcriptional regulator n=1 Tax=Methylocapsa sp. S129 TaxID=1641869 RepID=UPI001AEF0563